MKVCPGGLLHLDEHRNPVIADIFEFGWNGCWQCGRCLSVCPNGAVRVLGKTPENSVLPAEEKVTAQILDSIIANRHSCRRYQDWNVDSKIILGMINQLANAPNGGNKQQVEYTLVDDKEQMQWFRDMVYSEMERLAEYGIYPKGFDKESYEDMKRWEKTVRPDMLFCGAPHILIPHALLGRGEPQQDVIIAGTYFELLCTSRGLGAVMLTFPLGVLERMPDIKAKMQIPDNHYIGMMIGFGYPEIQYARGAQRDISPSRIHRLQFEPAKKGEQL